MAVAAFLYGWTAVADPGWLHSLVMPLLWLALLALTGRWFLRRPRTVVVVPVVAVAAWAGLVLAG